MSRTKIIQIVLSAVVAACTAVLGFFTGTTLASCSSTGTANWDVSTVWKPFTQLNPELGGGLPDPSEGEGGWTDEGQKTTPGDTDIEWSEDLL